MTFHAQVKQVSIKETASNDKEVKVTLITDDVTAMGLQKYIAESVVQIEVKE